MIAAITALITLVIGASTAVADPAGVFHLAQVETEKNPFSNDGTAANPRPPRRSQVYRLRITERDCRRASFEHRPRADVAYQPGVDVRGNPVVPADVPTGYRVATPTVVEFDLAFNPLGNTGLDADDFANTQLSVGRIRYDILKNELTLNGRPLQNPVLAEIERQCRAAGFLD